MKLYADTIHKHTYTHTQASTYQTQNTVRIIFEIHKNRDGVEVEKERGLEKIVGGRRGTMERVWKMLLVLCINKFIASYST